VVFEALVAAVLDPRVDFIILAMPSGTLGTRTSQIISAPVMALAMAKEVADALAGRCNH